jgi:hypothetical protein
MRNFRIIKPRWMRLIGNVVRMWDKKNPHTILVEKAEVKRPLGKPRPR